MRYSEIYSTVAAYIAERYESEICEAVQEALCESIDDSIVSEIAESVSAMMDIDADRVAEEVLDRI